MTNKEIHQALNTLYTIARKAPVDADTGDLRENCAKVIKNALLEKFPIDAVNIEEVKKDSEAA